MFRDLRLTRIFLWLKSIFELIDIEIKLFDDGKKNKSPWLIIY